MKVNGLVATAPAPEIVVIPRKDGNLVFTCECVIDFDPFDKLCPKPTPPIVIRPGNIKSLDYEDEEYIKAIEEWGSNSHYYMMVSSIKNCVEFDLIKLSEPATWKLMDEEFKKAGIIGVEYSTIIIGITTANGLNTRKLDEAKESFLAEQVAKAK